MADVEHDGEITLATSVSDLSASIAWFQDVLGFELNFRGDEAGWAELTSPTSGVTIGLGVRFDGDNVEIPDMVRLATFFDPDGNSYMLAQSLM